MWAGRDSGCACVPCHSDFNRLPHFPLYPYSSGTSPEVLAYGACLLPRRSHAISPSPVNAVCCKEASGVASPVVVGN